MFDALTGGLPPSILALALLATFAAAFVKGAVGFAMPLIMIVTLPSLMPLPQALAAAILPILVTNLHQSLRDGIGPAWATLRRFWRYALALVVGIALSAPLVVVLDQRVLFIILGLSVLVFAAMQLRPGTGDKPPLRPRAQRALEWVAGGLSGFYGGFSGVWGPPAVAYMLAAQVDKRTMSRALCTLFSLGAIMLLFAHLRTGVLNAQTAPLSALLLIPALAGTLAGFAAQDRMDAARFRFWVTIVLIVSALNLLRRGLWG
jgi:uncharacterized membrane protein YfcA